jgi:protein TonB
MKNKKSIQADLENKKGIFLQLGMIAALSIILISFEWTSSPKAMETIDLVNEISIEDEMLFIPRERPPENQIKPELPKIAEVLDIVDDNVEIEDFKFDMEVSRESSYDFKNYESPDEVVKENIKFYRVEEMPAFNGGKPEIEFRKYIARNLVYPDIAASNGVSGRVTIEFAIDETGKVVDAVIIQGVDPALDKEAKRVVLGSPLWTPGKQRGKAVKVHFVFPITFVLQ